MKQFVCKVGKGICVFGQSMSLLCSFILTYMCFYRALTTAGMSTILFFIGSVIAFVIGIFGLWALGKEL